MEIIQKYEHSKFGNFMFKLCAKFTKFILNYKWLYYLLACTWGIILTLAGLIISLFLLFASAWDKNILFYDYCWVNGVKVGPNYWGGLEMGLMFMRDQKSSDSVDKHEFGHTFQNCILGPFTLFLVTIPSATRYWYQTIREKKGKQNKPYDSFWAEDAATQCGEYAYKILNNLES